MPSPPRLPFIAIAMALTAVALATATSGRASDAPDRPAVRPAPAAAPARVAAASNHWAFQPLPLPSPGRRGPSRPERTLDDFIRVRLNEAGLSFSREADRGTLIRRVAFILTGLPPEPEAMAAYRADRESGAHRRMVERYLASPRHGERWAKHWLDAAGYADSNGYFSADSDRPLAYRYRDYVIRSLNRDKPFDQFVREQLAGDELSGWKPGQPATPEIIELLEATHFLRNGQDGSGESDGNPDEVRTDRYYALESAMQIIGSSLLGLTVQCAKCHDHKFEPITQQDYYGFQAVLYPAFNVERWTKPNDRVVLANLPGDLEAWTARDQALDAELTSARQALASWAATNRVPGQTIFLDPFSGTNGLAERWTNTAPGDDAPAGSPPVAVDADAAPAARVRAGALQIVEGGGSGDRWLCTREAFDWRPAGTGQWIQVTFDLVAAQLPGGRAAERIGYLIAAHDFNDNSATSGGNILLDGNPGGATSVHLDYPGADSTSRGSIGATGYQAGHNYGVRVTRTAANEFTLEHLVDGAVDGGLVKLRSEHLPPGAFAFEYCCGRSFVVDNVRVERSDDGSPGWPVANGAFQEALAKQRKALDDTTQNVKSRRTPKPGRIAWMTDAAGTNAPQVHLLKRGNHKTPGDIVEPSVPAFLARLPAAAHPRLAAAPGGLGTGRRLAWARWLTEPGSPQASLLARVTVNRVWQQYFGVGLVATPDNFGLSGARPTHPELLDWLAAKFIESGWSLRAVHRLILDSATFRQASAPRSRGLARDPDDQRLWRYPLHRLDAEAIRDGMLAAAGRLGGKTNGPYVPTPRSGSGEVTVDESQPEAFSRSVFLQQRRTQIATFLGTFDAPSVVFNCTRRAATTMPLQSLSLLNSDFAVKRGQDLAHRLEVDAGPGANDATKVRRAFLLTCGREPDAAERRLALRFLEQQRAAYAGQADAGHRAWADFGQSLFGLNAFLYLE